MKQTAAQAGKWIVRRATSTPLRATVARYVLCLALVAAIFAIIPHTPLDGPVGGVIALTSVIVVCWFSGVGPALLMPLTVWFVSRFPFDDPEKPLIPTAPELMTFFGLSMLTGAVGLAGQYRTHLRSATQKHDARMREQARALSAARIVFRDVDGQITSWTEGAQQLYGWESDEAVGRRIQDLLHTAFPVPPEVIRSELLRGGQWRGEVTQVRKDGQQVNISLHCIPYMGQDDGSVSVAEIHSDITELRVAEAAIRESDRRKDLFVATLAHELRNPLAPLRTGLEVLRMKHGSSSDDGDILNIMTRQLEHMVRMVDDLLDVSRINTGKVELRLAPTMLADVIRDTVASCRSQIEAARQKLIVTIPNAGISLQADAGRLVQVLMNLLSNASKFTDAGGEIRLSAEPDGQQVVIRVQDTGAGIPVESLPRIFDMFAQIEDPYSRSRSGLGLGLNIVRTLVDLHGGTVEARSEGAGHGSEFIVRLPALINHVPVAIQGRCPNSAPMVEPLSQRVLVVDDNRDAACTLTLLLSKAGFVCRSAFDGPSAIAEADDFNPHAVILDLGMPGMNGLEVAKRFRAKGNHNGLLLIAVTGWDKEDDRRLTKEAGFDHHLSKPVPLDQLRTLLGSTGRTSV